MNTTTTKTVMNVSVDRLGSDDYNVVKNIDSELKKLDRSKFKKVPAVKQNGSSVTIATDFMKESRNGEAEKLMIAIGLSHDVITLFKKAVYGNASAVTFGNNDNYEPVFTAA